MSAKPIIKKAVLAYSGGLDTSVILKWLQDEYQCEVVTFTADIGQGEEVDPVRTTAGLVERDALVEHELFAPGEKSMGLTIDQDMSIFPAQQSGMRSRGYRGSYLSGQESRISRLHELVDDYIEGRRPEGGQ